MIKKEIDKIDYLTQCSECGSKNITSDKTRGELVCNKCGLILDENIIDSGPEWRAFDSEQRDKRSRTGSPMTYTIHDKGLSTRISWNNRDSYGKSIPTRNRAQLFRLRKWQRRIHIADGTERNLSIALSELNRLSSQLNVPRNVRETAAMIYRKAFFKKLSRGRTIEGIVAASLYAACRQLNVPRTLNEIAKHTDLTRKKIGKAYRHISLELNLKLLPTSPLDYISRFCSILQLNSDVQNKAIEIINDSIKMEITSGRGPTGIAAAAIYIASVLCDEKTTQRDISEVAGVTEVTIRNRYKEMSRKMDIYLL